jgi:hypothetical protein
VRKGHNLAPASFSGLHSLICYLGEATPRPSAARERSTELSAYREGCNRSSDTNHGRATFETNAATGFACSAFP